MRRKQAKAIFEMLGDSLRKDLYGRSERDIEMIIEALFEYRLGSLKTMPMTVFNKMCPVLPKGEDYTVYDNEIREKVSRIDDQELRIWAEAIFLDPQRNSTVRQTRNLHHFQLLAKLATISQEQFVQFVHRYFREDGSRAIYDVFEIAVPFLWAPRGNDKYPYFGRDE